MSDEDPRVAGRRRSRGAQAVARADALQRLKALRSGGRRSSEEGGGFHFKMEDRIYDTVDEGEYEALVAKRREEAKDFIVDDDGLGYGDEGQEEDWSIAGVTLSSDESDGELERPKRKKNSKSNNNSEKKEQQVTKKPSALTAAAALMGKQRISNMFTSSVFKKNRDDNKSKNNFSCDSIVDDVIAEFAPDDTDRERRKRANPNLMSNSMNFVPVNSKGMSIKVEKDTAGVGLDFSVRHENNGFIDSCGESVPPDFRKIGVVETNDTVQINGNEHNTAELKEERGGEITSSDVGNGDREDLAHGIQLEVQPTAKLGEKVFNLNAKIKEEKDLAVSATAGWQAVRTSGNGAMSCDSSEANQSMNNEEKLDFELDANGSLPFYILDAHEEIYGSNAGNLFLFGKVKSGDTYHSCCVVVKNMQRCVYAIPNASVFHGDTLMKLQKDAEESKISSTEFHTQLHEMASGLKTEISKQLLECNVSSFSMAPVKRNYAFERSDIPQSENYVLKIGYPFKDPPLPSDIKGENFCALLGTHSSALEIFLVKRKIKGPSWLSISRFSSYPAPQRVSWCKFEVSVDSPKDIQVSASSKNTAEIPTVVVTAINLKTIINEKQNHNEIVSASVICCKKAKIDAPMLASEWTRPGILSHFTVVRKIEGAIFPMGFTKEAAERNTKAGSNVISSESSERALLNRLMIELHKLDSDVLVGHNISGFDLDILLHRFQACKVPSSMWSKVGRLKRSVMPRLSKGNNTFGSGASPGMMSCIAGRLLCDTYLCSRDLLKEVSYSLTQLAKTQLNKHRKEITPHDIPGMFQNTEFLMELAGVHLWYRANRREYSKCSGQDCNRPGASVQFEAEPYLHLHWIQANEWFLLGGDQNEFPKAG